MLFYACLAVTSMKSPALAASETVRAFKQYYCSDTCSEGYVGTALVGRRTFADGSSLTVVTSVPDPRRAAEVRAISQGRIERDKKGRTIRLWYETLARSPHVGKIKTSLEVDPKTGKLFGTRIFDNKQSPAECGHWTAPLHISPLEALALSPNQSHWFLAGDAARDSFAKQGVWPLGAESDFVPLGSISLMGANGPTAYRYFGQLYEKGTYASNPLFTYIGYKLYRYDGSFFAYARTHVDKDLPGQINVGNFNHRTMQLPPPPSNLHPKFAELWKKSNPEISPGRVQVYGTGLGTYFDYFVPARASASEHDYVMNLVGNTPVEVPGEETPPITSG